MVRGPYLGLGGVDKRQGGGRMPPERGLGGKRGPECEVHPPHLGLRGQNWDPPAKYWADQLKCCHGDRVLC